MRCLNQKRHAFKIGPDCFEFCQQHFKNSLVKLIILLLGPIEIKQEQIKGLETVIFDRHQSIIFVKDGEPIADLRNVQGAIYLSSSYERYDIGELRSNLSIKDIETIVDELLPIFQNSFSISFDASTIQKVDINSSFKNQIYAYFNGDRIQIPIDELEIEKEENQYVLVGKLEINIL
jgi:hypothetical protein